MPEYHESVAGGQRIEVAERLSRNVADRPALHAPHVIMPPNPPVVLLLPAAEVQLPDKSSLGKNIQIPVHRA